MTLSIKTILYILITPLVIWALDGININQIFKKNRVLQATTIYVFLAISLSYLVVNFLFDFFLSSRFI